MTAHGLTLQSTYIALNTLRKPAMACWTPARPQYPGRQTLSYLSQPCFAGVYLAFMYTSYAVIARKIHGGSMR
jgi:hypothetical protein